MRQKYLATPMIARYESITSYPTVTNATRRPAPMSPQRGQLDHGKWARTRTKIPPALTSAVCAHRECAALARENVDQVTKVRLPYCPYPARRSVGVHRYLRTGTGAEHSLECFGEVGGQQVFSMEVRALFSAVVMVRAQTYFTLTHIRA